MRWKIDTISGIVGLFRKFFGPEKRTVAVEIDGDIVKLVESIKADGMRKLMRIDEVTLSGQGAEPLRDAMKRLFGSSPSENRVIELNIPCHNLTTRYLKLPSVDDNELEEIVPIEALKHVPYSAEDIMCGYRVIEKMPDGYSHVQLAIAEAKAIKDLAATAENAGLAVKSVRAGFETLLEWYLRMRRGAQKEAALVVSVDPNYIDMAVMEGDKLTFTRGVSCHNSMTVDEMTEQVKMSADAYRNDSPKFIETVFVTGSVEKASRLVDALSSVLAVPVSFVDQAQDPDLGVEQKIALSNASYTGLLGIALDEDSMKINLMPPDARSFYAAGALKKSLFVTVCLALAVCLAATGLTMKKLNDKIRMAAYLDAQLKKVDPNIRKARVLLDSIESINAARSMRPRAIDVLSESVAAAPRGVFVGMLNYESGKTFTIRGTSPSMNEAFDYAKALDKSSYFENVRTKYVDKRAAENEALVDFEIIGNISREK
ncbi:MAG: pilus assembly protein PilM [Candidatus Omnitrophica bacterium]|nr:pilus assembly protein PilM [Candidatus Omnitrophota bacterium]